MILLLSIVICLIVLLLFENQIRKRPYIFYIGVLLIGLLFSRLPVKALSNLITRGTLATALFVIVMYARVLPVKSKLFKITMSLRAPIAIAGGLLILVHNATTLVNYIKMIFVNQYEPSIFEILAGCCSLIMFLLLVPLTATSFSFVRKKMNGKKWKKLQRTSYLFYGLIYVHVCLLFSMQILKGRSEYCVELAIYSLVFGVYMVKRVALALNVKKHEYSNLFSNVGCGAIIAACGVIILIPYIADSGGTLIREEQVALGDEDLVFPGEILESVDSNIADNLVFRDGVYEGSALGYNDNIVVKVTVEQRKITDITLIEASDDDPYFNWAWDTIPKDIIGKQDTQVDSVSGATYSSKGIKGAVENALKAARKKAEPG